MTSIVGAIALSSLLSFGAGYAVRELISRHRRAVAREQYYARKEYQARFQRWSGHSSNDGSPTTSVKPPASARSTSVPQQTLVEA